MVAAMDVLEGELLLNQDADAQGWLMGAVVDPSALYLGGHSLGAGMAMMVAAAAMDRGWATEALAVDLEQPYTHASDENIHGSLTARPNATLVHVAIAEDDTSVDPCHGVGHAMRWHHEANISDVVLLQIPSDRHGFPPLIASHYLASTPVHDTLADHAFYRRVDAKQSGWSPCNETTRSPHRLLKPTSSITNSSSPWEHGPMARLQSHLKRFKRLTWRRSLGGRLSRAG